MNLSRHAYAISEHYAPALINNDYTGLNDSEETALKILTDNAYNTHGLGFWDMNPAEEPEFTRCEVIDLLANCLTLNYITERK